ncbi:MAG: hypothetical protein JNG86_00155 [Verrucomicrobiaceae bacterium]|nr:hypothetical protein [Verrucomicrobiaceae bacterium]
MPSSLLTLTGFTLPSGAGFHERVVLQAGDARVLLLSDEDLRAFELLLLGVNADGDGEVFFNGISPKDEQRWSPAQASRVARTFSPVSSTGCWIENLDVDENILLPLLMRGESAGKARERAMVLAKRFGLPALPGVRRGQTPPGTLSVCQWVRAFVNTEARLFLMVDPLRRAPRQAVEELGRAAGERQKQGAAFLWVLPADSAHQIATLGMNENSLVVPSTSNPPSS